MKHQGAHKEIIEQVPPDYYQKGVRKNFLQRKWHTGKLNAVLSEVDFKPRRILDIGCASGWFLSRLASKYPQAECYGIDMYGAAIKYGQKKYPKLKLKTSDAHKIPYKDNMFDLIVCTEVLEHVEDPKKVLDEMKRLLTKDGKAIIELDSGSILFSVVWYLWRLGQGNVWNHSHLHSFNVKKLSSLIKKTGLETISKKRFNAGMAMVFSVKK